MIQEVRVHDFDEIDPARAAGSDHRQLAALSQALDEFIALFQDGQVGGEIGVEHFVKPESPQGRHHLAGNNAARAHAQGLAQRHPHRRGGLDNHVFRRIAQRLPHGGGIILLDDRRGGAHAGALAAVGAGGFFQALIKGWGHGGAEAAVDKAVDMHALALAAGADAAAAQDALVLVADQRGIVGIQRDILLLADKPDVAQTQLGGDGLQFAVEVALAGETVLGMIGQQEFHHHFAACAYRRGIGADHHAFVHRIDAGSHQGPGSLNLHHAHPAGSFRPELRMVTQRRHLDACLLCRFQNTSRFRHLNLAAVDRYIHQFP